MFFETYFLCSYNRKLAECLPDRIKSTHPKYLMLDCPCYKIYQPAENFTKNVILARTSYMACVCYNSKSRKRKRTDHLTVPIILGSYLDYRIRGLEALKECRSQWGAVILKGMLKIYSSFSTFDALSMHIRLTKGVKSIDWFTYVKDNDADDAANSASNGNGLAINYSNGLVSWTYKHQKSNSAISNDWIELLRRSSPFEGCVDSDKMFQQTEYLQMFESIQKQEYNMNNLQNRQFVDGPAIISKFIDRDFNKRLNQQNGSHVRMSEAFERGALYSALRKTNNENEEWNKNYPQNYDNTLHDGRSDKVGYFLPTVIRTSNSAIRNSNALEYPRDAINFFCMLNTKDLKSAGEQNVLADFVIMTEKTDPLVLYDYLARRNQRSGNTLVVNGYIVPFKIPWSLAELVRMKRHFGHVTTKIYSPYILFSTRASIPIKYSEEHDVFFSPAETTDHRIDYPEADLLSTTAKLLGVVELRKTMPAKATVSINNIKGSVANVTSEFHRSLMENNLGITCYIDRSEDDLKNMIDLSVLSEGGEDTSVFQRFHSKLEALNCFERPTPVRETDPAKAMKALSRMYPMEHLLIECTSSNNPPFKIARNVKSIDKVREYMSTIFSKELYSLPSIWDLRLRACFGNPFGACIEDGVVLDKRTVESLPKITYNACITVEFSFNTKKKPKLAYFIHVNDTADSNITKTIRREETLIGCVISSYEAHVKNSKHTLINMRKVGQHYYYLIHFLPKLTNMYQNLTVTHTYDSKSLSVVIRGRSQVSVEVGSKVSNKYGQKNICSMITDLSDCWGITRSGRKVHAQIVYSEISLVGRMPAGQLYEMLTSDELALGPNGEIIAPVQVVLHTLHPYTNNKVFDIKVDTMTNVNGFMSQNLCNASYALRGGSVLDKAMQVLTMLGMNVEFVNVVTLNPGDGAACEEWSDSVASESEDAAGPSAKRARIESAVLATATDNAEDGEVEDEDRDDDGDAAAVTAGDSKSEDGGVSDEQEYGNDDDDDDDDGVGVGDNDDDDDDDDDDADVDDGE